jgi:hypothetical protein
MSTRRFRSLLQSAASPPYRTALIIVAIAVTTGAVFATSYSLALGRAKPHEIPIGLVGNANGWPGIVGALEREVDGQLAFRSYDSARDAETAIREQQVYAALVLEPGRPRLLVASASGASVARVLEQAAEGVSQSRVSELEVVDLHPLSSSDPQGLIAFYVMLAATILGFLTIFQLVANARGLPSVPGWPSSCCWPSWAGSCWRSPPTRSSVHSTGHSPSCGPPLAPRSR